METFLYKTKKWVSPCYPNALNASSLLCYLHSFFIEVVQSLTDEIDFVSYVGSPFVDSPSQ